MDGWTEGWTEGRTEGRTGGKTEGRTEKRTDGETEWWSNKASHNIALSEKILSALSVGSTNQIGQKLRTLTVT